MIKKYYTNERNVQIVLSLLKEYGIRKVIVSPGTTNITLMASMQQDAFFEMYSAADERSAAYMACGLAAESGEPVVLSCTGATASRNYIPGLTEAYYRKLPIVAITSTQNTDKIGHLMPQVIDRSVAPLDIVNMSIQLPNIKDADDVWNCEIKTNKALLALTHRGGGPVHINLATTYSRDFSVKTLPNARKIGRICIGDSFPEMPAGKIGVFVGSHPVWTKEQTEALDCFCASNDAIVFCDHTSGYKGAYRFLYPLEQMQEQFASDINHVDLCIHIGEISGAGVVPSANKIWRVSEDGQIRDTFRHLQYVFEMPEQTFFESYTRKSTASTEKYLQKSKSVYDAVYKAIDENQLPFSNIWIAYKMAPLLPENSVLHLGILNSLRSWNFFEVPQSVNSNSNVGGFGIDGGVSSLIGASLANRAKLYFGVFGDLAFFYDMNSLGNRHIGNNLRIMLINNGKGTEFRQYNHPGSAFGEDADTYIAAAGHYGNKSYHLVKHYATDLGFEYLCASDKQEFEQVYERFLSNELSDSPILLEIFTNSEDESAALKTIRNVAVSPTGAARKIVAALGPRAISIAKKIMR